MKNSRKFSKALLFGREVLVWFAKAIEDCSTLRRNRTPYQTKREGNRVFLIQRCQNSFGRFIKLIELGTYKGNGIIDIPKGKNKSGWDVFVKKLKSFANSSTSISRNENRGVSNNAMIS